MKNVEIKSFKKTLSKFTTGVSVVCVNNKNKIYGKTVNSFNSLSLNPPLVLFSLGNYSSSIKNFIDSNYLTINILAKKQKNISNNFSQTKPVTKNIDFVQGENDTYYINGCIANLECKLIDRIKKGDHIIFICKVSQVMSNDKLKPLIYFNSNYY